MYGNNILNFKEATTILNVHTKTVLKFTYAPTIYIYIYIYIILLEEKTQLLFKLSLEIYFGEEYNFRFFR